MLKVAAAIADGTRLQPQVQTYFITSPKSQSVEFRGLIRIAVYFETDVPKRENKMRLWPGLFI
jgi:hypothetical protein